MRWITPRAAAFCFFGLAGLWNGLFLDVQSVREGTNVENPHTLVHRTSAAESTRKTAPPPSPGLNGAECSSRFPQGETLTEESLVMEVSALVSDLCKREAFSGTVLIAERERVIFTYACGEASRRFHVPVNIDTKFNLGSMNKMFTSVAVMRLVEDGLLSVDDNINDYVDETWLPKEVTSRITIRHLLTHTSGLGSYFNQIYQKRSRALFRKLEDYKPLIRDDRPAFEPGSRFLYSNTGMFLLGVVIEKATGEDYFAHIRARIYDPAGMKNTDCYQMDDPVENLAIGYSPAPESPWKWRNNLYQHVIKGGPAGGGFSTVIDLHRFALALLEGKLVSKYSLDLMWKDHTSTGYGFGFQVQSGPMGKVIGHSGGFPGINSNLDIYPEKGWIVAAMCNQDRGAASVTRGIGALLARFKDASFPPLPFSRPDD